MKIPENVAYILRILEENGYEGFAVGGCVRDTVLGREPEDWDITTSAKPEQVKALFRRTIDTGIQHGTVTVMMDKIGYEVTTYRMDGEYEDHRHPTEVIFTPELTEDLKRRDFTINAMAFNPVTGMVDKFDGIGDIEKKRIRCVGNPMERFEEDALRMLRGIRFAGQLLFEIEPATLEAIRKKADTLVNVSAERIRTELTKLLLSDGADRLLLAHETGLSRFFLPELDAMLATSQKNPHHRYDVGRHTIETIRQINRLYKKEETLTDKDHVVLVYAALLHDVAKPDTKSTEKNGKDHFYDHDIMGSEKAKEILRRLKFDNDTIDKVTRIVRYHDYRYDACFVNGRYSEKGKKAMRKFMNRIGKDVMPLLFLLQEADLLAQSDYKREEKYDKLRAGIRCYGEIIEAADAIVIKDLAVGGRDIMELGVKPGPMIGEILQKLLEEVLSEPSYNERNILLEKAKKLL